MRSQLGTDIDGREAYIQRVLLNVYGGPGVTNVWIDDLEIAGYVGCARRFRPARRRCGRSRGRRRPNAHPARRVARSASGGASSPARGRACI